MPDEGFLRRWARRKTETRLGREPEPEPQAAAESDAPAAPGQMAHPAHPAALADGPAPRAHEQAHAYAHLQADAGEGARSDAPALAPARAGEADAAARATEAPSLPTMDDVATLTRDSDYSSFVARGVDQAVRRSALKKLFADPHFNTMDRLDIYIDDYTKPSPVSETMLASLRHSARLFGRVADEVTGDDAATATATATAPAATDPAAALPPDPQDRQQVAAIAPDTASGTASEFPSATASELPPETETR